MEIKTLDERIRTTANGQLKKEISSALQPVYRLLKIGFAIEVHVPDHSRRDSLPAKNNAHGLLEIVEAALYTHYRERREEEAVAAFIEKVDSLQNQVLQLREEIEPSAQ
jgi:hypothetical protein